MRMKNVIAVICAALVGGGVVAGIAYKSKGFTDWTKENWLNVKQSEPADNTTKTDTDGDTIEGGILVNTGNKVSAMRLNAVRALSADDGISTQAETSYTITATIMPANADNQAVSWTAAWKNAGSEWASGKNVNDYISLDSDGLICVVSAQAAFGEKIVITCTSLQNLSVTASCTVDYVKRITLPHGNGYVDIDRVYQNNNTDKTFQFNTDMMMRAEPSAITYGTGTVRGTIEYEDIRFSVSDTVKENIKTNYDIDKYGVYWSFKECSFDFDGGMNLNINVGDPETYFISYSGSPSTTSSYKDKLHAAFVTELRTGGTIHAEANFSYKYGNTVISTGKATSDLTVNTQGLSINVSSLDIDTTSLAL